MPGAPPLFRSHEMANQETPNKHTDSADTPRSQGQAGDLARGDPESLDKLNGRTGGGDSGGGAYPNPHTGQKPDNEGFMGHGGQSDMNYHGTGQLGKEKTGENANAPTRKSSADGNADD